MKNEGTPKKPSHQPIRTFRATVRMPGGVVLEVEAPDAEGLADVVARVVPTGPEVARQHSAGPPGTGRPAPTRPSHADLARTWKAAVLAGKSPRQLLAAQTGASVRAISRWAAEAREAGFDLPVLYGRPKAAGGPGGVLEQ